MAWLLSLWLTTTILADEMNFQNLLFSPMVSRLELTLPVSWEIITTGFNQSRVASVSESYSELWTFSQQPYGESFLASPRARVPVHGIQRQGTLSRMPRSIIVTEQQLAALLGIELKNSAEHAARLIFLELQNSPDHDNSVSFQPGRDEHVTVSISFHN